MTDPEYFGWLIAACSLGYMAGGLALILCHAVSEMFLGILGVFFCGQPGIDEEYVREYMKDVRVTR